MKKSVDDVTKRWGGPFEVRFESDWKKALAEHKKKGFVSVHLTMYGLPVDKAQEKIAKSKKVLVIVGSRKVEREVYEKADWNVAVTSQPHSEIAALAVFLDRAQGGKELAMKFRKAERAIVPQERGKKVVSLK